MKLSISEIEDTLSALITLGLPAVYSWEADDSPKSYAFLNDMIKMADERGGRVIRIGTYDVTQMTNHNLCSGKFLYTDF